MNLLPNYKYRGLNAPPLPALLWFRSSYTVELYYYLNNLCLPSGILVVTLVRSVGHRMVGLFINTFAAHHSIERRLLFPISFNRYRHDRHFREYCDNVQKISMKMNLETVLKDFWVYLS